MTYLIQESPIAEKTSPSTYIVPNQQFEKRFLVGAKATSIAIEQHAVPEFTHESYNTTGDQENVLRVSADSQELLSALVVAPLDLHGVEFRPSRLKGITCTGSAVVVLDESVIVNSSDYDGDLNICVPGSAIGHGDLQIAAPILGCVDPISKLLAKESLRVSVTGSGDMNVFYLTISASEIQVGIGRN